MIKDDEEYVKRLSEMTDDEKLAKMRELSEIGEAIVALLAERNPRTSDSLFVLCEIIGKMVGINAHSNEHRAEGVKFMTGVIDEVSTVIFAARVLTGEVKL